METNAEAKMLAGKFLINLADDLDIAHMLYNYVREEKAAYGPTSMNQHLNLLDAMQPIVLSALTEIGDLTHSEGVAAAQTRKQQEQRVLAVVEQFGLVSIHPEDNLVIKALTDALFGAAL